VDVADEVVCDKGAHSRAVLRELREHGFRTYFSEPERGDQSWIDQQAERDAVYANRRRIRGARGLGLLRKRGELLERTFAHAYDTGGMRRIYLRGHKNILKRVLIHGSAFNLGLMMRHLVGVGTPRGFQGRSAALITLSIRLRTTIATALGAPPSLSRCRRFNGRSRREMGLRRSLLRIATCTTCC